MSQDIHTHLEKLKTELNKLEPAVKHLQKADENATALIASLSNINNEFSKHLQSIEKSLSDANEKHQKQLTKEIQESTKKINDATELLSKSNSAFDKQIKNLLSEYSGLGEATTALIKKIESVDFPNRLEKLDNQISSINIGVGNLQTTLQRSQEKIEKGFEETNQGLRNGFSSVNEGITSLTSHLNSKTSEIIKHLTEENKLLRKETKTNRIIQIAGTIIIVILLVYITIKLQ